MASSTHRIGPNFRAFIAKAASFRLSDAHPNNTTDYAEIICGDGVPSGAYGRNSGATLIYLRKDASAVASACYVSVNGGTAWTAMDPSQLTSALTADNDWTGTQDISKSVTGTDQLVNADLSVNHATQIGVAVDATAAQLTTARTTNYVAAFRGSTTSLAADTATVIYPTYLADAPTDGGTALHHAYKVAAGYDAALDVSGASTGEADILVGANLADAMSWRTSALSYMTLKTTTASPGITETWAHTGTAAGHALTETISHATQVGGGFDADVTQLTNARTGGYVYSYRAKSTSLAGDLNGVIYAGLYELAPTDGGGTAIHTAVYAAGGDYVTLCADSVLTGWGTGTANVPDIAMGWDGTRFNVTQAAVNSEIRWGVDDDGIDQRWYGATASAYALWDQSADTLIFGGVAGIQGAVVKTNGATAITTTRAVTRADSGGIFTVAQSSAYTITVAQPTAAGERYLFQCIAPGAFDVSIVATGCTFEGTITIDASTIPATGSTLKFATGAAVLGDNIELVATSTTKFFVRAISSGAGGISIA